MDKKIISIYMGNPDNSNHAELELPATPWEMVDAMDRLRLSEGQEPYWQVEDMGRYEFLAPHLDGYDLYQFNALAEKLRTFSDVDAVAFEGLVQMELNNLYENDTAYTLLKRVCREKNIEVDGEWDADSAYITQIGSVSEFTAGPLSAWLFTVNGTIPDVDSQSHPLEDGDVVEWHYTCDFGNDIAEGMEN